MEGQGCQVLPGGGEREARRQRHRDRETETQRVTERHREKEEEEKGRVNNNNKIAYSGHLHCPQEQSLMLLTDKHFLCVLLLL